MEAEIGKVGGRDRDYADVEMGFLASAPFMGLVLGNLLGGYISDKLLGKRRKPMMMLGAFGTILMMVVLIYAPNNAFYLGITLLMDKAVCMAFLPLVVMVSSMVLILMNKNEPSRLLLTR